MFTTLIVQPIFNLLVLIYALIPGHNFGLALIIFTIIIRLLLWPLVKRQLHGAKKMRRIQPELRRIAKETKGDRQKQAQLQMELYKEQGINPFGSLGLAILQIPILFGLYAGLQKVVKDSNQIIDFAYPALQNLPWLQHLKTNIHLFDSTLFGVVDLSRAAIGPKGLYIPALIIVVASAIIQYFQAKQLLPDAGDGRKLRDILKDAGKGEQADQSEISGAVGRSTVFILPVFILLFTINLASALGLYWFIGGLVAFIQQSVVLREDKDEMTKLSGGSSRDTSRIPEAEIVSQPVKHDEVIDSLQTAPELQTAKPSKPIKGGTTVTKITRTKKNGRS